ncbi:hypothetical protein BJ742DRAFT_801030 [Cladochytrium replicatum]|nr:hypothetical protein BJ742DRAFT_801030 [Cladochytrium replicatum]
MRIKHRYLLFEVIYLPIPNSTVTTKRQSFIVEGVTASTIAEVVRESIALNFGDRGMGLCQSSLQVKYFSHFTNLGIVRVGRDHARMVWGALTFVNLIGRNRCIIRVQHVGGTIKSCQEKALELDRSMLRTLYSEKQLKGSLEDIEATSAQSILALDV